VWRKSFAVPGLPANEAVKLTSTCIASGGVWKRGLVLLTALAVDGGLDEPAQQVDAPAPPSRCSRRSARVRSTCSCPKKRPSKPWPRIAPAFCTAEGGGPAVAASTGPPREGLSSAPSYDRVGRRASLNLGFGITQDGSLGNPWLYLRRQDGHTRCRSRRFRATGPAGGGTCFHARRNFPRFTSGRPAFFGLGGRSFVSLMGLVGGDASSPAIIILGRAACPGPAAAPRRAALSAPSCR